ncbi:MAG: hypothetical protein CL596_02885 [Alteromonas sp.]|nr:hypothetical protein [Alteromonas sp.]MAY22151.1 hypothetical protein [Flavobacteriaceae bacterium]
MTSCLGGSDKKEKASKMDASEFRTESALSLYEMQVPKYMSSTTGLNADASMQFQNIYKETYLAVIEEPKKDFIEVFEEIGEYDESNSPAANYQTIQMNYFTEGMQIKSRTDPVRLKINGLNAEQVEVVGRVPDIDFDIYYLMTFIEGSETLYMMMEWTLETKKDDFKNTFKYMANSFTEI